ncbi:MAG: SRPBCC domain-containing protein [Alphaproteobacteria bacterium]|nr:SRPBCC domain-containing protein [Alphaproteobacteria bacterium]
MTYQATTATFDTTPAILTMERRLPAPRARVFAALTRADMLGRWCCPSSFTCPEAEADARVGGRYRLGMRAPDGSIHRVGGEYREIRPPDRLVFTWSWEGEHELAGHETLVTIELDDLGKSTMLRMTHTGLPSNSARISHREGWTGAFDNLARLVGQD